MISFLNRFKPDPNKRYIKDVKVGETINIEWNRIKGGIGELKCLGNDPNTKKIFLEVKWNNYKEASVDEVERIVLDYNSEKLTNFNLLNQIPVIHDQIENALKIIEQHINDAIKNENYEELDKFNKKLNNILKPYDNTNCPY